MVSAEVQRSVSRRQPESYFFTAHDRLTSIALEHTKTQILAILTFVPAGAIETVCSDR